MNDAMVGLRRFDTPHVAEPDRGKAIQMAIQEAQPGDVVLLAGKGHETYQILKDRTIHFDDRETAREVLLSFGYKVRVDTEEAGMNKPLKWVAAQLGLTAESGK